MMYYLGSECDAPLTEPWAEGSPGFHVSELDEWNAVVRKQLDFPCVRYIGAHSGCGCGFRRELNGYLDTDPEDVAAAKATQADHEALVAYLRALPSQSRPMQIYGCWSGEEAMKPLLCRSCSIAELSSRTFGFRERELLTLVQ